MTCTARRVALTCADCGAAFEHVTRSPWKLPARCPECARLHANALKREGRARRRALGYGAEARASEEAAARRRGIVRADCGCTFDGAHCGRIQQRCPGCAAMRTARMQRAYQDERRHAKVMARLGRGEG